MTGNSLLERQIKKPIDIGYVLQADKLGVCTAIMKFFPTRTLLCLCIAAPCLPAIAQNDPIELPDIGTVAGSTLTIDQELIYGDAYMRSCAITNL